MSYVFPAPSTPSLAIVGRAERFPVHRIYCVGRNYEEHAQEMGFTGREPPFFFLKPADTVISAEVGLPIDLPYPSLTSNLHHEIELVVAIGKGGTNIPASKAVEHIFGYAVGLDMTRRDLQGEMKKQGRPWCIGKAFEHSAPITPITLAAEATDIEAASIALSVNGTERQRGLISQLIWRIEEVIEQLSSAWTLQPGDLIYTGTPAGVAAVKPGDVLSGRVDGLCALEVHVR